VSAAEKALDTLRSRAAVDAETTYTSAVVFFLGRKQGRAFEALEAALHQGFPACLAFADPVWAPVQGDARFQHLRTKYSCASKGVYDQRYSKTHKP
jgi:hypothetical protein